MPARKFRSKLRNRYSKMGQSWAKSETIVKAKVQEHKYVLGFAISAKMASSETGKRQSGFSAPLREAVTWLRISWNCASLMEKTLTRRSKKPSICFESG